MRKTIFLCLALLALPLLAAAAPISIYDMGEPLLLPAQTLDSARGDGFLFGPHIVRLTAPNGQDIHIISELEQPPAYVVDADFDGVEDLAIMVSSGASSSVFRLFVNRDGRYVRVHDGTEEGLFNPRFYPAEKLVLSQGSSGYAGALHEDLLFAWQSSNLTLLRRALCQDRMVQTDTEDGYNQQTHNGLLHSRVWHYREGEPWAGELVHEDTFALFTESAEAYEAFHQREQDALWEGLR